MSDVSDEAEGFDANNKVVTSPFSLMNLLAENFGYLVPTCFPQYFENTIFIGECLAKI